MAAEWALIGIADGCRACVIGRERPGQQPTDQERVFDGFLGLEPDVVRAAAEAAIELAGPVAPEIAANAARHLDAAIDPDPAAQLRLSGAITSRFVAAFA